MMVVAELGINTNGNLDTAFQMIEAAAEAGVDAIKVQAYETKDFLPEGHPDWDFFERNRLNWDQIEHVRNEVVELGLYFGGTPTSVAGIKFLEEQEVDWLKNGSDFLLRDDLIEAMLDTGIQTWVSLGMATEDEYLYVLRDGVTLMACTSAYPCPEEEAHLARLSRTGVRGLSDHTVGTTAAVMAVAMGAEMYEFHFTLDHDLPGPDHWFSRTPSETEALVREVRCAEAMLGRKVFVPTPSELESRDKIRVKEGTLRG